MKTTLTNAVFLSLLLSASLVQADDPTYKPYIKGTVTPEEVKAKLEAEKFEIVGEYEVDEPKIKVIVITNDTLKETAAKSTNGGFGAVMRVGIIDKVVSYTNPPYWAYGYRMANGLAEVKTALEKALGNDGEFGSKEGKTEEKLRKYHYAPTMPYFDDPVKLLGTTGFFNKEDNTYSSYTECVETVEAGLKSNEGDKGKTKLVYRVDVPGKDETVFGMGLVGDYEGSDANIMKTLNEYTGKPEHAAYLPYEILCSGNKSYILAGKFRIALSFPDLKMLEFMKIRKAPDSITEAAKASAALPEKK